MHAHIEREGRDMENSREFSMSYQNFQQIKKIAYEITGINLSDHKQNMVYGRLARRLRALNLSSFDDYVDLLGEKDSDEIGEFTNAITTNLTSFFRESHHFDYLKHSLLPDLLQKNHARKRIRIWSAGCSSGEEPYSIALVVNSIPALRNWDVKILATDLDTNVVAKAKAGIYPVERVASVSKEYLRALKHDKNSEYVKVNDDICRLITFKQLNLLHDWPMKGPFDIIFCRNVVIYFDTVTQRKLFNRYAELLTHDGHLVIGHSENLNKVSDRFSNLGRTIYRRIK